MLKKEYVRDGKNRVIGSVTTGFSDEISVVRDGQNQFAGRIRDSRQFLSGRQCISVLPDRTE
jgi:hypothetical protein